jgi:hypothetical protein
MPISLQMSAPEEDTPPGSHSRIGEILMSEQAAERRAGLMQPPFGKLEYLYVGTVDFERDVAYYRDVLGAEVVWAFHAFGARVAALRVCAGPLLVTVDYELCAAETLFVGPKAG